MGEGYNFGLSSMNDAMLTELEVLHRDPDTRTIFDNEKAMLQATVRSVVRWAYPSGLQKTLAKVMSCAGKCIATSLIAISFNG